MSRPDRKPLSPEVRQFVELVARIAFEAIQRGEYDPDGPRGRDEGEPRADARIPSERPAA